MRALRSRADLLRKTPSATLRGTVFGGEAEGPRMQYARTVFSSPTSEGAEEEPIPVIPGYDIDRELGRGGMGVVYRAFDTKLGRRVAIKMLLTANAVGEEKARFVREAEAAARFEHPNIVHIYAMGETGGRPFFALEYVEGGSLEDQFGGKPMPWRQAAELLSVIARAVHAAHVHGIIHRDLKPANIL